MGGATGLGGGGEVGLADGEEVGLEGEDVGILMERVLVGWVVFGFLWGWGGYYSVGFFEELIARGGAGERVLIAAGMVSLEEFIEGGGYVGHQRGLDVGGNIMGDWQLGPISGR